MTPNGTRTRTRTRSPLHIVVLAVLLLGTATTAQAQLTYYGSRAGFNGDVTGTTLVDFEAGVITTAASGASFAGPLDATTNNGVFATGNIPAGIAFANSCAPSTVGLVLAGAGFDDWGWSGSGGFPSKVLIPSNDVCSLSISFSPAVDAVGLDIYAESDSGFRVQVFGEGDALLGGVTASAGETTAGFFGVLSTVPITRIEMKAPGGTATGNFEAADNVAFRAYVAPDPVPALGGSSLALLAVLLAAGGLVALRRTLA